MIYGLQSAMCQALLATISNVAINYLEDTILTHGSYIALAVCKSPEYFFQMKEKGVRQRPHINQSFYSARSGELTSPMTANNAWAHTS
jgi:hypothetical protein